MKKYKLYKPSGNDWIGDIPENWEIKRLKHLSSINGSNVDKNIYEDEKQVYLCNYTDVYYNEKLTDKVEFKKGSCTNDEYEKFKLKNDDIIITKDSETPDDIGVPSYVTSDFKNVVCGYHLSMISTNKECLNGEYLFRQFQTKRVRNYFEINSNGITRYGLGKSSIENLDVITPPIKEQLQIVNYLNEKTELIDKLISTKERKIDLLKSQRTSLIYQVVTKGLNPKVKMKHRGIEWIGFIPNHWEISKVKYKYSFKGGGTPSKDQSEYWDGNIPWVSPKDMKSLEISTSQDYITPLGLQNSSTSLIEENSLLIVVRSGILQRTIPIGINTVPVSINQDLKSLTSKNGFPVKFLYYFIKGNEINLLKDWSKEGTTVESIEMEFMSNSIIPFPPKKEQEQIVKYLDTHTKEIDDFLFIEQKKINLLKEYRQSLISEVITGKIDVRTNLN